MFQFARLVTWGGRTGTATNYPVFGHSGAATENEVIDPAFTKHFELFGSRCFRCRRLSDNVGLGFESRDRRDVHFADPRVRGDVPSIPSRARVEVPPKKIPFFKPGKELRELVERI